MTRLHPRLPRVGFSHDRAFGDRFGPRLNRCYALAVDTVGGSATLSPPGEAESGSAGVQPDEEYPGRRCADGASGPRGQPSGALLCHRTPELCLKKLTFIASSTSFAPRFASLLALVTATSFSRQSLENPQDSRSRPCTYLGLSLPRSMKIVERSKKTAAGSITPKRDSAQAGPCHP